MVFSLNNTISWRIQELPVDVLKCIIAAAKQSGNFTSKLGETTDLGNDAQFMVFVRYRATEDYVQQFFFCSPLAKHTARKEMLQKVDSFTKEYQFSRIHSVSVCAHGAYSAMISIKKTMNL